MKKSVDEFIDENLRECLINLSKAKVKKGVTPKEIKKLEEKIVYWDEIRKMSRKVRESVSIV